MTDELRELDVPKSQRPKHIAIIMDGNGRWAQARGLDRHAGHRAGVDSVRSVVEAAGRAGVQILTLYSFSTENWKRPEAEVTALLAMITELLPAESVDLAANNIRFRAIGDRDGLPESVQHALAKAEALTADNDGMVLTIAINYGSRQEIAAAARTLALAAVAGDIDPSTIGVDDVTQALWTRGLQDPDLLIRTAGEMRLSNFLLWQISYAEIVIDERCWPDFGGQGLHDAIETYASRTRTRGGLQNESLPNQGLQDDNA
jgi:undecaprenyl diphosphate synthase